MIKIEYTQISGWKPAIRGARNAKNSWDKSDSYFLDFGKNMKDGQWTLFYSDIFNNVVTDIPTPTKDIIIGPNDLKLLRRLAKAGSDEAKYRRDIDVYFDITAPMFWWKEMDTYKVGTVRNSCSTMHTIHEKPFSITDFSVNELMKGNMNYVYNGATVAVAPELRPHYKHITNIISSLNNLRDLYKNTGDKQYWRCMIEALPSSYNQRATLKLNYEVLSNIYHARRNHKLDEWHHFCHWIEELPYAKEIIFPDIEAKEEEWVTKYCENDVNATKEAFNKLKNTLEETNNKLKTVFEEEHK